MPVVVCIESKNEFAGGGSHLAAAVMGAMCAKLSEPSISFPSRGQRTKPEKTQATNPNRLTCKQHVLPKLSIKRFLNHNGRVAVRDIDRQLVRNAKPSDFIFYAQRAWDQRAEAGYMKRIEDEFQAIASSVVDGRMTTIAAEHRSAVDRMFALWYMRSRYRELVAQEIQLHGVPGSGLTKAQEENAEKNNYVFARGAGKMPARQLNGLQLERRIYGYVNDLAAIDRWGIIHAQAGEFIVPDVPSHTIFPLAPQVALAASTPDGIILEPNLAEINRALRAHSQQYFFARDFSHCPF